MKPCVLIWGIKYNKLDKNGVELEVSILTRPERPYFVTFFTNDYITKKVLVITV